MTLPSLIDKLDSSELVLRQIAAVLRTEFIAQQALAVTAGKNPLLWAPDIYLERDFPIDKWIDEDGTLTANTVPNITVSIESSHIVPKASSPASGFNTYEVTYLIDILARGVSTVDEAMSTHTPADKDAHDNCHATVRLCRNILGATEYRRLQLSPTYVWNYPRWTSVEYGKPPLEEIVPGLSVWAAQARYVVQMKEFAPEYTGETLQIIGIDVSDHGGVILSHEVDTTV